MPRGRPPIPRTKEEALEARREQIRKNVKAFRQRKRGVSGVEDGNEGKSEGNTYVSEDQGKTNDHDRPEGGHSGGAEHVFGSVQEGGSQLSAENSQRLYSKPSSYLGKHVHRQHLNRSLFIPLPPEINPAHLSLDQLASAATIAFSPTNVPSLVGPHWTQTIPHLTNIHPTLDHSILALCLMQISHVHQQPWLLYHSLSSYSRALQALRVAIAQPSKTFRMEVFATSMGLAAYELLQGQATTGERGRGWMAHIEGATSYLNMFPDLNVYEFSHEAWFHFLETICIFDALGARRPSCFSSSKWWRYSVDRLGDQGYEALLRMITTLPAVLEKADAAVSLPPSAQAATTWTELLALCERLEDAFLDWFDRNLGGNETYQAQPDAEIPASMLESCKPPDSETDFDFDFPSLYVARLDLLYWSCTILLYESMTAILQNLLSFTPSPPTCTTAPPRSDDYYTATALDFALKIRRSVHFCLRPEHGVIGASLILLPLWIARNHLSDCGDVEARWCDGVLEGMGKRNMVFGLKVKKGQ